MTGEAAGCLSVGVEEEFLLADPVSGATVAGAEKLLLRAGDHPFPASGGRYHRELLASQVEAATGVCRTLDGLHRQIQEARAALSAAATREGLLLLSSGTPVLAGRAPVSEGDDRYRAIAALYAGVVTGYQVCGCHVHTGVADRDTAVAVLAHLRPWLPALLALSANSPYDHGRDSGHASWRMVEQSRFPGSGVPPFFASAADYDRGVDRLVDCGVIADPAMSFWLARLSPRYPTVEVRAADAVVTAGEAVLQAALTRALVAAALADLDAGREAPPVDPGVSAAAVWSAARYGLEGPAVHPFEERRVPVDVLIGGLMRRAAPSLEEAGDLAAAEALLARLRRTGSGARRQREAAATGGLRAAVGLLARQTTAPSEPASAHRVLKTKGSRSS
ncbi:carboxylate-amine ligase [Actinomadura rugatobispora]|uniref:Putative glutamate--cysteine ligase 2 n=1 Tax=Actinomadura rugatobispora TaxID=1994 RepID=A0ABW1A624_9ACTN